MARPAIPGRKERLCVEGEGSPRKGGASEKRARRGARGIQQEALDGDRSGRIHRDVHEASSSQEPEREEAGNEEREGQAGQWSAHRAREERGSAGEAAVDAGDGRSTRIHERASGGDEKSNMA